MYVRTGKPFEFITRTWHFHLLIIALAIAATALEREVIGGSFALPPLIVTILGTALAFFIGFINNQAYDRWWEARKIWGAFVNDSRNFGHMVKSYFRAPEGVAEEDVQRMQQRLIQRHIAFLKATVVKLRGLDETDYLEHLTILERSAVAHHAHKPNGIALLQRDALDQAERLGYIDGFRFLALNRMLDNFFDDIGKAERIKSTVFPLAHVYLTRACLWLFVILLPMSLAGDLGWWSVPFAWLLGTLYIFTFAAGQSIVNPFANKPSDTPMSTITRMIEMNLLEVMDEDHQLLHLPTAEGTHKM